MIRRNTPWLLAAVILLCAAPGPSARPPQTAQAVRSTLFAEIRIEQPELMEQAQRSYPPERVLHAQPEQPGASRIVHECLYQRPPPAATLLS